MQRRVSETSLGSLESQSDDDGVQEGSATQDTSSHDVSEHLGRTVRNTTQEKKKPHDKKKVLSRQPAVGPEIYVRFEQQVRELDAELRKLGNKARALGRSAGILAASTRLRERLGRVLYLFRENALALYPVEIKEHISVHRTPVRHVRRWKTKNFLDPTIRLQAPLQDVSDSKHDSLAQEFWQLSKDVITLFECFGQYPEFLEELPDFSLAEDLQAWAKLLLDNFEHEFSGMAFQQFLFDSMPEIGARLETLAKQFIQVFTKIGIPTVKASQDHGASNLQNQTIVAALFAGVATGMIQVFTTNGTGGLHDWIVLLWYMTLIFSVASAVNGLLNLSWMQAIYRSPDSHVPWWVIIWIKRFPLVFLVLAVGCFFVALILFALTPQQNRETLIVTVALSSASCFGLIVVSGWFSCELVVYNVYGGRKWLADIIWKNNILAFVQNQWSSIWEARKKIPTVKMDLERANFQILRKDTNVIDTGSHVDLLAFAQLRHEEAAMTGTQKARARWQAAMKKVLAEERRRSRRPVPKTQMSSKLGFLMDSAPIYTSRYNTVPKLHRMTVSASHPAEDIKQAAMVRCLQFSPNGLLLVSTRWNGRSTIFHLSDKAHPACCCTFPHPDKTGYVHQVDWAPNGEKLLMRSNRKLIVWSVDGGMGEPNKTEEDQVSEELRVSMMMERKAEANELTMRSASWKPDSTGFIFAEGRRFLTINTLNQTSKLLPDNSSQHLELRSLCLSSDGLIVGTGRIVQEDARLPKQYCIIIWELSKKFKVAKKIPVFYEISNVTLASDNRSLLVSYANKAPSQLWHITYDKKAAGLDLILRHNYRIEEQTGQEVSFAPLPSIFGGENDHLVLRATMTGDIHIWDRESAKHVYCVKPPPNLQGRVTSFTWNRGSEEYMFATGMHDGTVHIWTCGERRMMSEERQQLTASPTFDSDSDSQRHDSSGGRTTLCD